MDAMQVMHEVFVARQPIFDRSQRVFGYELLFRQAATAESAEVVDDDSATAQVILNALMDIGFDELVGASRAFINMPRTFLLQESVPLPPERVVLEVLEHETADAALVDAMRDWSKKGYILALDDFVLNDERMPLVPLADIVKVEINQLEPAQLARLVRTLRQHKVALLAEKVESFAQFERCLQLGFDYFQGYFMQRPKVMRAVSLSTNQAQTLKLLASLYRTDLDLEELENLVASDLSLSYKLLRYLNSPLFPIRRRVDTIRQALVYLGLEELRAWAALIVLSAVAEKPPELILTLMARARMCELLALAMRLPMAKHYFTIGLFSGLDALLDAPLDVIIERLGLGEEMQAALLDRAGLGGRILEQVIHYERGAWSHLEQGLVSNDALIKAYLEGLHWARRVALIS